MRRPVLFTGSGECRFAYSLSFSDTGTQCHCSSRVQLSAGDARTGTPVVILADNPASPSASYSGVTLADTSQDLQQRGVGRVAMPVMRVSDAGTTHRRSRLRKGGSDFEASWAACLLEARATVPLTSHPYSNAGLRMHCNVGLQWRREQRRRRVGVAQAWE